MRETSSRSSTSWLCARALRWITATASRVSFSSSPPASNRDQPRMAVSGVRSSCDTTAMNSSFARDARSAASRAATVSCRSRVRSRSVSRWRMAKAMVLASSARVASVPSESRSRAIMLLTP